MTFQISNEEASFNHEKDYNPGNIFRHPCLGKIRCDEFILNEDGKIIEIICSIVHNRDKRRYATVRLNAKGVSPLKTPIS